MSTFRVVFETIYPHDLHNYCDRDPLAYKTYTQTVPNSQIPDDVWREVEGESFSASDPGDPWGQYRKLKEREATGRGFVRNVRLQTLVPEPHWEPAKAPWEE
jgi:hypothetical protein